MKRNGEWNPALDPGPGEQPAGAANEGNGGKRKGKKGKNASDVEEG